MEMMGPPPEAGQIWEFEEKVLAHTTWDFAEI